MDQKITSKSTTSKSKSKSSKSSCIKDDVFQQPEFTNARLEFEQLYPKIIKPFQNIDELEEEENEVQDFMENIEEYEDEDFSSEPNVSMSYVMKQWIDEKLDDTLPADDDGDDGDVKVNDEIKDKENKSEEQLMMIKRETNEFGKENVDNLYKIFLDRYRATNGEKCESVTDKTDYYKQTVCSEEICKEDFSKSSYELNADHTKEQKTCPNNDFELLSEEWNIVTTVNNRLEFHKHRYLNHYVLRPPLFPTKDGHLYHQDFVFNEKYSRQYSNLMYGYLKNKLNRCIAVETRYNHRLNSDHTDVISKNKIDLQLFNYLTISMIYYRKVELLGLLCKSLALQKELNIVNIEHCKVKSTQGVAVLLAMNWATVETLNMYNFFDKTQQILDNKIYEKDPKQALLDIMETYEFEKHVERQKHLERVNTDCQRSDIQDLLSDSVQIVSPNKPNPDKYKAINKCCFLEKEEFKFSGTLENLKLMITNGVIENNSLSFVERLRRIKNIGNKSHVNITLYKYCMASFTSLKSLSCNYHYIADPAGSVIKSICDHKTLNCLQLFIEPTHYLKLNERNQHVNIISDDIWKSCKESCQQLRVHFVIREMNFSDAGKFIKKSIPLYSIHISSGSIVEDTNNLQPLLEKVMKSFPENLQIVSITLWKHNEDLDNTLTTLFQKLKDLQILEYCGHVVNLKDTIERISKVKHGCVKRIILTLNNHSKQDTLEIYRQYCQTFQSDGVAFSLMSLKK